MNTFVLTVPSIVNIINNSGINTETWDANDKVSEYFKRNPGLTIHSCGFNQDGYLITLVVQGEQSSALRW